jgi:hypothetical protein
MGQYGGWACVVSYVTRRISAGSSVMCGMNPHTPKSEDPELLGKCLTILLVPILRDFAPREGWQRLNFSARSSCCGGPADCRALARYSSGGQLAGSISYGLSRWHHRAGLRRTRLRRHAYLTEECCAGFLERIFLHWAGLAHLGLLISSFFILLPAPFRAVGPLKNMGRRGLATRPKD